MIVRLWRKSALVLWVTVALIWLLIGLFGQRWGWLAFLVYLPPLLGPLLLLGAAVVGVFLRQRISWLLVVTALFIAGPGIGWRSHYPLMPKSVASGEKRFSVVTCNRGQHHGHSIALLINSARPDLVALQDGVEAYGFIPTAPEWAQLPHTARFGEFVTVSRYPLQFTDIKRIEVPRASGGTRAFHYAARYLVKAPGQDLVVYNVHLPSPRHVLTGTTKPSDGLNDFWNLQQRILDELTASLASESLPTLALGDFNLTSYGPRYRQLTATLQDSHVVAGSGYGFTAPGDVNHILSFRQPWLRLDYILASQQWEVLRCITETPSVAQHAAVHAVLRLR